MRLLHLVLLKAFRPLLVCVRRGCLRGTSETVATQNEFEGERAGCPSHPYPLQTKRVPKGPVCELCSQFCRSELAPVPSFCRFSRCNRFVERIEIAQPDFASINLYPRGPLFQASRPIHARDAASVVLLRPSVPHVFCFRRLSQITEAVVAAIAVDVIDLHGPSAVDHHEDHAMRPEGSVRANADNPVTKCLVDMVCSLTDEVFARR